MKKLLLITLLLIVGCSKEPINYETTLIERDGVFYTNDTNEPYSGPVFSLYDDGKKKEEGTFKDGKGNYIDGLEGFWGYLKRRLAAKGGIRKERLPLYLAEYAWRYNHRNDNIENQKKLIMKQLEELYI